MKQTWKIKPGKSFRENARLALPAMLDDMTARKDRVVQHPRLKNELHQMRIDGKPLRYAMEIFEPAFGVEYKACFEEVKRVLEVMGEVHDCDVAVPALLSHLREMRLFNGAMPHRRDAIATKAVRALIKKKRQERDLLFAEMCGILERWTKEDFKGKLIQSMQNLKTNGMLNHQQEAAP